MFMFPPNLATGYTHIRLVKNTLAPPAPGHYTAPAIAPCLPTVNGQPQIQACIADNLCAPPAILKPYAHIAYKELIAVLANAVQEHTSRVDKRTHPA